jgi:adenosylmethionine-8-amino-7-oxononanoate aminotransferase
MAVGARSVFTNAFEDLLFSVEYLSPEGGDAEVSRCEDLARQGDVACFIFEPSVQGAGGMKFIDPAVLDRYCAIFQRSGALCIADEIMTGFGRTGPLFATSEMVVAPDLVCLSKGLTSGTLPLAVTMCREAVFREFVSDDHSRTFFHGHTFTANPIACAVALASLDISESGACANQRTRINRAHCEFAERMRGRSGIEEVRVRGTILAFDVVTREAGGYVSPVAQQARQFFIDRGVLLRPLGNVVYCMPPYCVTEEELVVVYAALEDFVNRIGL